MIRQCKEAAATQNKYTTNRKLKNLELRVACGSCKTLWGTLKQKGINVKEGKSSPFYEVCKDVFLLPEA